MDKMLEFEVLVILQDDQTQKWENMGKYGNYSF